MIVVDPEALDVLELERGLEGGEQLVGGARETTEVELPQELAAQPRAAERVDEEETPSSYAGRLVEARLQSLGRQVVRDLDHDRPVRGVVFERKAGCVSERGPAVDSLRQQPTELEPVVVEPDVARLRRQQPGDHSGTRSDVEHRCVSGGAERTFDLRRDRQTAAVPL